MYRRYIPIHSSLRPISCSPAAGPGRSFAAPSIIPRQECIKDSSPQLNLKEKTITPGIGAELWRPPIKLFAFDLVLRVLPPRLTWTGEYMDVAHSQAPTKYCHPLYIPVFIQSLRCSLPLFQTQIALVFSIFHLSVCIYPFSATQRIFPSH